MRRGNPLSGVFAGSRDLAPVDAPAGSLVMYSSAPSTVVACRQRAASVSHRTGQAASRAGLPAESFQPTRMSVSHGTQGRQVPWVSNSLVSDFLSPAGHVRRRGRADAAAWHIRARIPRTGCARRDARAAAGVGDYSEDGSSRSGFLTGLQARSGGVVAGIDAARVVVIHRRRSDRGEDSPGGHDGDRGPEP